MGDNMNITKDQLIRDISEVIVSRVKLNTTGVVAPDMDDDDIIYVEIENSPEIQISEKKAQINKLRLEIDALEKRCLH